MSIQFKAAMTCAMSAIFFACATPALADTGPVVVTAPSDDERSTLVVKYGDLNLAVARDQKRLDRRVGGAIREVCGFSEIYAVRTIVARTSYQTCSNDAWTRARVAIGAAVAMAQGSGAGGIKMANEGITVTARTSD